MWNKIRLKARAASQALLEHDDAARPKPPSRWRSTGTVDNLSTTERAPSLRSAISSYEVPESNLTVPRKAREKSKERHRDPLGLSIVYEPEGTHKADIIFVHGLGGTSRQTWSRNRDSDLFWPGKWLPFEEGVSACRILSFGYNTYFMSSGPSSNANILDFAKELLFEMLFGKDRSGNNLNIGKIPVIFVVHSMGGLVVKKAYILGRVDPAYREIVKAIRAILFLSTPHRGTNLAEILNKILAVSFNQSSKAYITDLKRNSSALADINEQFRHYASDLRIMSFYETLQTPIGPSSIMVLEKDSAVLGYPNEISKPMVADHHDVCKYGSLEDSNYISLRNALQSTISRICHPTVSDLAINQIVHQELDANALLGAFELPESDYNFFIERWMPGTCEWILTEKPFKTWYEQPTGSTVLWLHARPASGKSILSAYIIKHLNELGAVCQYHFFRFGNQLNRSLAALLRSLALQAAEQVPDFRLFLQSIFNDGVRLDKADARTLWQRLFVSKLFKLDVQSPLYWVIDAIDESDSPKSLLEMLQAVLTSNFPIRILIVSRYTPALSAAFERLAAVVPVENISLGQENPDLRLYVDNEMQYMHGSKDFKGQVIEKVLEKAEGNFLWVHLASKEILQCNTRDDIELVLDELPAEMKSMYYHMESQVARSNRAAEVQLARLILTWVICSRRPLHLTELSQALQPSIVLDLKHTISQVCGHFIVVDGAGHASMVHQTAREFLTTIENLRCSIDIIVGHEELLSTCLNNLLHPGLRRDIENGATSELTSYSATSWAYHLKLSNAGSEDILTLLVKFLHGYSVLTWIQYLATSNQLKSLAYASQALALFAQKRKTFDSCRVPTLHRLKERDTVELWATDLVKVLGKFGGNLVDDPASIYNLIPRFCPKSSAIHRQFGKGVANGDLVISGFSNIHWDDALARLFVGTGMVTQKVLSSSRYFAVLVTGGTMIVWDATTFEEKFRLLHKEHVTAFCISEDTNRLASYGFQSTIIWDLSSGLELHRTINPIGSRALSMTFARDDTAILIGSDDRNIRILSLFSKEDGWQFLDTRILREETVLEGTYHNSPCCMAFNQNATQVAVAYRGFPLSVWTLDNPKLIGRCKRSNNGRKPSHAWTGVDRVTWHPVTDEVLGLYNDGCIFKWHPFHQSHQELYANASELACTPDGALFGTSDVDGNIKIYNYQHFALVYKLSWENPVKDLTFSPDCRRLYDIRGSICNVWEPNVLIRLSDTDDHGSESFSEAGSTTLASMASETSVDLLDPIVALCAPSQGDFYSAGNDEGIVYLFDDHTGQRTELWHSSNMMPAHHLAWSPNAKLLACAEDGGKITVKNITSPSSNVKDGKWTATPRLDKTMQVESGGVSQILLDPSMQYLLVSSQTSTQIWSLGNGAIRASIMTKPPEITQRWLNHPLHDDKLIEWNLAAFTIHRWDDLTETSVINIYDICTSVGEPLPLPDMAPGQGSLSSLENALLVDRCMVSQDANHIMVHTLQRDVTRRWNKQLRVYGIKSLEEQSNQNTPGSIKPIILPETILSKVEVPLGVLPGDRLMFLDHDYWMCSWRLSSDDRTAVATRHFFLPVDWVNPDSLSLCMIGMDGAFLYPRNGEVAILRCAFDG